MTTAIAKRLCQQTHANGHSEEVTLPGILDRLSRLENEGFSYDELLHDFASRRRVGPVREELPAKHVLDPAKETDEAVQVRGGNLCPRPVLFFAMNKHIVTSSNCAPMQAYLSLTRGACSARSTKWASSCSGPRERLALCGLSAVNGHGGLARKPRTQPGHGIGTRKTQHARLENRGDSPVRKPTRDDDLGIVPVVAPVNESGRPVVRDGKIGFIQGDGYGYGNSGHTTRPSPEIQLRQGHGQSHDTLELHVEALDAQALTSSSPHDRSGFRRSSSQSSPRCSTPSPRTHVALDYYPSRPVSAGEAAAVSLISPRTSKRIRRLPRPAESELQSLQVHASNAFAR